ncbi:hypothetical protein Nepgr_007211 [Nepenthes gracilis]|uniref:RING-type domain-containing protein n=1 Tax=Nepenthes gracilis TaxID=150966 RepID=A0AAD3XIA4_NEPGR|nr:hypothetical protein Nepgr_007211 [Nepenthes gracilis]
MAAGDSITATVTGDTIHQHIRRQLNHLHRQTHNQSSQSTAQDDPHLLHWHYAQFDDRSLEIHGQTLLYIFILFSIILLVTLFLLYARWFFRFPHLSSTATVSLPHIVASPPPPRAGGGGLEPTIIQNLPIVLHQSSAINRADEIECCICLGAIEDGDKVKVLPECRHGYHSDCVDRWLINRSNCPLCRIAIRVDPQVEPSLE